MRLPLYNAMIDNEGDGVLVMSLVETPATDFSWLCFTNEQKPLSYSICDEEKHILCGVVMKAATPIYRRDQDGFEYYIQYSKETLEKMAEKMLYQGTFNKIDLQHDGKILPEGAVILRELFIKDTEKGISPKGFEDVPDGSLLCTYKVNDMRLWENCKNGTFNGFSLEGLFTVTRAEKDEETEVLELIEKLKNKLKA